MTARRPGKLEAFLFTTVVAVVVFVPDLALMMVQNGILFFAPHPGPIALLKSIGVSVVQCGLALGLMLLALRIRKLVIPGLGFSGTLRGLGFGAAVALGAVAVALLLALAMGGLKISPPAERLSALISLAAVLIFFHALLEELLFRLVLCGVAVQAWPRWLVGSVSSLVFAAAHLGNNAFAVLPALNVALAGALLFVLFLGPGADRVTLGRAQGFHFMWNFALTVLGVPVSGWNPPGGELFTFVPDGSLWSGGAFGLEGSPATTIVMSAAIAGVVLLDRRQAAVSAAT